MKAIILTAGRGARLGAATADRPKCLIEIEGRTLLERQVSALRSAGASEVACVVGWRAEAFSAPGLPRLFVNRSWATTSMVESLACAASWLQADTCLVSYGDIVYSAADARRLAASDTDIAIGQDPAWYGLWELRFADPLSDAETFRADEEGYVLEIGNRPETIAEIGGQYVGLLRFTPRGWAEAARVAQSGMRDMTDLLSAIVAAGRLPVKSVAVHDPWWEFDQPSDLIAGVQIIRRLDRLEENRRDGGLS